MALRSSLTDAKFSQQTKWQLLPNRCYQQPFFQSKLKTKTMIQGKEIKIGNYLKDRGGKVLRVDFIEYVENGFDTKFGQKMFVEGQEVHPMTEYSDYAEPIQLSGEWLEKFGFVKTADYGDQIYYEPKDRGNRNYYICFDHDDISFGLVVFGNCTNLLYDDANLQFVHQFQNLYYALTGVELSASKG